MKVILIMMILAITGIGCLIYWHKKIDPNTTWVYGIYIAIILIIFLFVLLNLEQFWLTQG